MVSSFHRVVVQFFLGLAFLGVSSYLYAQSTGPATPSGTPVITSQAEIPDAPASRLTDEELSAGTPAQQIELAFAVDPQSGQAQNSQPSATGPAPVPAASGGAAQSNSSSQAPQPNSKEAQHQKAEEEVKEQEHQRIGGIVPTFNMTYHSDAVPLSPAEKFQLEYHAAIDPYTFSVAAIVAGIGEAEKSNSGFGWGPEGYGRRVAAAYADNVIGNTLGNAVLPSILHQDPRYYRLGHGSIRHRLLYALATTVMCKHDGTGKWEPNYSNIGGNILGGEISNLYYPDNSKSNFGQTIGNGMTVTAEGAFGSTLEEFWPDISRKFFHKDPTHGLDAQARAKDATAKQKKQQGEDQNHQP
jgi:hypothetical protein